MQEKKLGGGSEANIEEILGYAKRKTEEIEEELSKIEQKFNLNNISLTGEDEHVQSLYTFEGEDYKARAANGAPRLPANKSFFESARERKQALSYDIDKYYREAFNQQVVTKEKRKLTGWRLQANGGYEH